VAIEAADGQRVVGRRALSDGARIQIGNTLLRFSLRMLRYMTSSIERRLEYYEAMTWWEFVSKPHLDTLAEVHFQRGELEEAEKVLKKALDLAGQEPPASEMPEQTRKDLRAFKRELDEAVDEAAIDRWIRLADDL
jgi:hypothetical protein